MFIQHHCYNKNMKLIAGLGNPGGKYAKTRHNAGFMCVDALAEKLNAQKFKTDKKFSAQIAEVEYKDEKLLLVKPQTYMNESGKSINKLVNFYKCEPKDLLVVYDDIDLPLGSIRLRQKGSAGSHNGMKSIIESLGFSHFPRLRIGIENREKTFLIKEKDLSAFVLSKFNAEEKPIFTKSLAAAIETIIYSLAFFAKTQ